MANRTLFKNLLYVATSSVILISCRYEQRKEFSHLGNNTEKKELFITDPIKYSLLPKKNFNKVRKLTIKNKPLNSLKDIDFSKFPVLDTLIINKTLLFELDTSKSLEKTAKNITFLDFSNNKIRVYYGLSQFKNLKTLYLRDNSILELPDITGLDSLKEIDLRQNKIFYLPDILPPQLKRVGISQNPVAVKEGIVKIKSKHPHVEFY